MTAAIALIIGLLVGCGFGLLVGVVLTLVMTGDPDLISPPQEDLRSRVRNGCVVNPLPTTVAPTLTMGPDTSFTFAPPGKYGVTPSGQIT